MITRLVSPERRTGTPKIASTRNVAAGLALWLLASPADIKLNMALLWADNLERMLASLPLTDLMTPTWEAWGRGI